MSRPFPPEELALIDMTVRMFTQPKLVGDVDLLGAIWLDEAKRKRALMEQLGVTEAELQSAERFAELLRAEGIEPETKAGKPTSEGEPRQIYAFAKTDEFMRELLDHDDERIRTLAEARLGIKSTIDQTRAERVGGMAVRGPLAVYLNYCGTHTTLWSGGDGINWQNFKRARDNPKCLADTGALRKAIHAPGGYLIGKVDQSQVQCRLVNYIAGQSDVIERFRNGEDPYTAIASLAYGHEVYKPRKGDPRYDEMTTKRGTGKQLELSCGFGAGAQTIVDTAAKGTYGPAIKIDLATGYHWRDLYRGTHPHIVDLWRDGDRVLDRMVVGECFKWLDILEVEGPTIWLPNGAPIHWPHLQWDPEWKSYKFLYKRHRWKRIWGGFFVQNIVSALASTLVRQAMFRIRNLGFDIVLQEHDAVGVLVKNDLDKDSNLGKIIDEMRRSPVWMPRLPLDAEGSLSETYS